MLGFSTGTARLLIGFPLFVVFPSCCGGCSAIRTQLSLRLCPFGAMSSSSACLSLANALGSVFSSQSCSICLDVGFPRPWWKLPIMGTSCAQLTPPNRCSERHCADPALTEGKTSGWSQGLLLMGSAYLWQPGPFNPSAALCSFWPLGLTLQFPRCCRPSTL